MRVLLMMLVLALTGCKSMYNSDPAVVTEPILVGQTSKSHDIAYVWLPTANTGIKALYKEAFNNNMTEFSSQYSLSNHYNELQDHFDDFIIEQGGAFNHKTGELKVEVLLAGLTSTYKQMQKKHAAFEHLVVLHPVDYNTRVENGYAHWHGVKQQMVIVASSAVEYRDVMSLKVQYFDPIDEAFEYHLIGLDMHAPNLEDKTKYFDVIKHIFRPVSKLQAPN
ncbi:hypothetical protein C1E24_09120 [Pseudoalteromonas phenolica]|uniref:Uncharacterized protein n=1 Tax=Pseudoalteromonas phenolica TaxID=161398 RepID=A0A5R9Q4R3_9GAMM|nr:hypothetical protein [Pseudoalteromonas phenolica]TLX47496.1 hypothetical protein C1E24_09120 [Pseudoalteromonas phenolica]